MALKKILGLRCLVKRAPASLKIAFGVSSSAKLSGLDTKTGNVKCTRVLR